jgi:hypothetical protein
MHAWRSLTLLLLAFALPTVAEDRGGPIPLPPPPAAAPTWAGGEGWRLSPMVMAGAWREGATGDTSFAAGAGLQAEWRASRHHAVLSEFSYGSSRRTVLTSVPGGVSVREADLGVRIAYGYEFLHHWATSGRTTGELLVGGFWRTFQDQAAPTSVGGPLAGLRLGYRLASPLDLGVESTYGLGALADGSACCVPGKPRGVLTSFASVGVRASSARLRAGFRSDVVVLEHDTRSFTGLALILDLSL